MMNHFRIRMTTNPQICVWRLEAWAVVAVRLEVEQAAELACWQLCCSFLPVGAGQMGVDGEQVGVLVAQVASF